MSAYASVVPLTRLGRAGGEYTYALPSALQLFAKLGSLVQVPFGTRELQGIIVDLHDTLDPESVPEQDLRDVIDVSDQGAQPALLPYQIDLARWISTEYAASLSDVLQAMLPPGLARRATYTFEPATLPEDRPSNHRLTADQERVLDAIQKHGPIDRDRLRTGMDGIDVDRATAALVRAELITRRAGLRAPHVQPRYVRYMALTSAGRAALASGNGLSRAPRRRRLLEVLAMAPGPLTAADLAQLSGDPGAAPRGYPASSTINALIRNGLVEIEQRHPEGTRRRDPLKERHFDDAGPPALSPAQHAAYEAIVASYLPDPVDGSRRADPAQRAPGDRVAATFTPSAFLLHGVTGSGKTEVYMHAIGRALELGRQAIVMVPEIGLTPQAVSRFAGRFPGRVAMLHSRLSRGERLDQWQQIRCGDADIVVGPRSALFAPFPRLGIIIVDEEHDPSYKQDSPPRYHARDAAIHVGAMLGIPIVLGSATPDVATYYAARKGRFQLLELPERPVWMGGASTHDLGPRATTGPLPDSTGEVAITEPVPSNLPPPPPPGSGTRSGARGVQPDVRPMPAVQIVDLRQELKAGNRSIFSRQLATALLETLTAGHQALLFLNRRGNATVVICRDCGYVVRCPRCDVPLTYHSTFSTFTQLVCHRCDRRSPSPHSCPGCGNTRIRYLGVGTERVEEETARLLPTARVQRWDRDATQRKGAHEAILDSFGNGEADVLVGTQMIAKGLDFPMVTLVGVISADVGLHLPDFRAPERTFQLLTQVAGRAGRAGLPGKVIVQTYTPEHYAVIAARDHDYWSFYRQEMMFRYSAGYPPYSRLLRLVARDPQYGVVRRRAYELHATLVETIRERGLPNTEVIGPAPAFVARIKNVYQWHLMVRGPEIHGLLEVVPEGWIADIDPVDLL